MRRFVGDLLRSALGIRSPSRELLEAWKRAAARQRLRDAAEIRSLARELATTHLEDAGEQGVRARRLLDLIDSGFWTQ